MENQVAGSQQVADGGDIGGMAGDEHDRGRDIQKCGQRLFQITVYLFFAGDQPTGAGAGAIAVDRGLGGGGNLRIAGHADIVVNAEVDELTPVDVRHASGSALVGTEIGIVPGHGPQHAFVMLQLGVLGKLGEIVVFGRNKAGVDGRLGTVDQILLCRLNQFPQSLHLTVRCIGHMAAERFFQRSHKFQTLQRIETQSGNGRIRRQVGQRRARQGAGMPADGGENGHLR